MTDPVVKECAELRAAAKHEYTVADAIADAQWLEQVPAAILDTSQAKRLIRTLHAALQVIPCFYKAARLGLPSFTLLPYDRAGHAALSVWADVAEAHGCRPEKVADARAKAREWAMRPDCKWPD